MELDTLTRCDWCLVLSCYCNVSVTVLLPALVWLLCLVEGLKPEPFISG